MKLKVLFICVHNSARSQMAEAFLKEKCGEQFEIYSAGIEPGQINPVVVEVMSEVGIDLSGKPTKSVYDFLKSGIWFHYIITVCDEASAERCPIFPGVSKRLHWSFPDPSQFGGSHDEKHGRTREVRNLIQERIQQFCEEECQPAQNNIVACP